MEFTLKDDKWLRFVLLEEKPKTQVYSVISKCDGNPLGVISWHPPWRHYCFFSDGFAVYSDRCLLAIAEVVTELNKQHKEKQKWKNVRKSEVTRDNST